MSAHQYVAKQALKEYRNGHTEVAKTLWEEAVRMAATILTK